MNYSISDIGKLIDAPIEVFLSVVREYSYGALTNIKKAFEVEYQRVEAVVIGLNQKLLSNDINKQERKDIENTLQTLYVALQLIEDRATVLESLKSEKGIKN